MTVKIDANTIITAAAVITAATVVFGFIFRIYQWYLGRKKDNADITRRKLLDLFRAVCVS